MNEPMTAQQVDSSRAAVVDRTYHWRPITRTTPRGVKLQLIRASAGVAVYGALSEHDDWYTHWAPLPTFCAAQTA